MQELAVPCFVCSSPSVKRSCVEPRSWYSSDPLPAPEPRCLGQVAAACFGNVAWSSVPALKSRKRAYSRLEISHLLCLHALPPFLLHRREFAVPGWGEVVGKGAGAEWGVLLSLDKIPNFNFWEEGEKWNINCSSFMWGFLVFFFCNWKPSI